MSDNNKIGVLITNYYTWSKSEKAIASVLNHGGDAVSTIVVVDDCSDAPDNWVGDSRVRIYRNSVNKGSAGSFNIGINLLEEDIIVVLDADAYLLTPFVSVVRTAFASNSSLAAVGFSQTDDTGILRQTGENCPFATEFVIGLAFWSRLPKKVRDILSSSKSFLCIPACCMALRKSAFNEIGGVDVSFDFLDFDVDFSMRLNQNGWHTALMPEVLCFHPGGGSPQSTSKRVQRLHRNRWKLLRKHKLIHYTSLIRLLLATRHIIELGVLWLQQFLSRGKGRDLRDKIDCRRQLLASVWFDYETR